MYAEITGTNFQNKGAELMLAAIASECLTRGVSPVVAPWNGNYLQRARLGLFQKAEYQRFGIRWHKGAELFPKRLRGQYGVVVDREIGGVLDASGFQFGDQWGTAIAAAAARRFARWKTQGKRIILLPQAFGPFTVPGIADPIKLILESSSIVFARDTESAEHLRGMGVHLDKIRTAPDFTNLLNPMALAKPPPPGTACILPNQRMIDRTERGVAEVYIGFLVSTLTLLARHGFSPVFLVHELTTDKPLIDKVRAASNIPFSIVHLERAEEIKAFLGHCSVVVASRFHALASALSQGVPVIATGWSHKYVHLMRDYGVEDALIDLRGDDSAVRLEFLLEPKRLEEQSAIAMERSTALKDASRSMWNRVFQALTVGSNDARLVEK